MHRQVDRARFPLTLRSRGSTRASGQPDWREECLVVALSDMVCRYRDALGFAVSVRERRKEAGAMRAAPHVTGMTERSMNAIEAIRTICGASDTGKVQAGDYLFDNPEMAAQKKIIASRTLVNELPLPVCGSWAT